MYFVLFNSFISISNSTNLTNLTLFSPCKILVRANFTVTLKVKFLLTLEIKFLFTLMNIFLMIISVIITFIIFWDLTIFILFFFYKIFNFIGNLDWFYYPFSSFLLFLYFLPLITSFQLYFPFQSNHFQQNPTM